MSLKDLLVIADAGTEAGQQLQIGAMLSREHGAHLVGLHVIDIPAMTSVLDAPMPEEFYEMQRKPYQEAAVAAQAAFEHACQMHGVTGEWRAVEGQTHTLHEMHARYVDLVIAPTYAVGGNARRTRDVVEHLILASGKPVLVPGKAPVRSTLGHRIVIGWDGSRAAARAVTDALPLLAQAERVAVVAVDPEPGRAALGDLPCADICAHLARHDVVAEAQMTLSGDHTVAQALIDWAKGQDADLVVVGGYGHSRLREVMLGGVTQHLLEHAQLPTLFSH